MSLCIKCVSPWCNHHGWLSVKNQISVLSGWEWGLRQKGWVQHKSVASEHRCYFCSAYWKLEIDSHNLLITPWTYIYVHVSPRVSQVCPYFENWRSSCCSVNGQTNIYIYKYRVYSRLLEEKGLTRTFRARVERDLNSVYDQAVREQLNKEERELLNTTLRNFAETASRRTQLQDITDEVRFQCVCVCVLSLIHISEPTRPP